MHHLRVFDGYDLVSLNASSNTDKQFII